MAHYIKIPEAVELMDPTGKKRLREPDPKASPGSMPQMVDVPPFTFERFVVEILLSDAKWTQRGYQGLRSARKIEKAVTNKAPGEWISIEDADWERLKEVIETPTNGTYSGQSSFVTRQLMEFLEAIMEAKDEKPEEPKPLPVKKDEVPALPQPASA